MVRKGGDWLSGWIAPHRSPRTRPDLAGNDEVPLPPGLDRQRIDKWLWHARLVRTRSAAATLAGSGYVRINGTRVDAASHLVREGDVITVALDRRVRVLKVRGFAERRGRAGSAQGLYEEMA